MQDFRRLNVWKRAHGLALDTRRVASRFPRSDFASLKSQMIRAAESIPMNIVEGCGAAGQKEFARFLDIAIKSCFELEYQFQLARDAKAMSNDEWRPLTSEVVQIRKMLHALRKRLLDSDGS
jgi:four helix bundle protein